MQVVKCPRCDINFMREGEDCCKICKRDLKGAAEKEAEAEICAECGENLALIGEDICAECYKERKLLLEETHKPIGKRNKVVVDNDDDDLPLDEIEEPIEEDDLDGDDLEINLEIDDDTEVEIEDLEGLEDDELVADELDDEDVFDSEDVLDDYREDSKQDDLMSWEDRERNVRAR